MVNKLLQGNDLEYIRATATTAMPDIVDIQRKTLTADKQGGYTEEWSNAYEGIPSRLATPSGTESIAAARQDLQSTVTLTINYNQSIEQADRVVHASGTYEVQFIDTGQSWASAKQCQMRRL